MVRLPLCSLKFIAKKNKKKPGVLLPSLLLYVHTKQTDKGFKMFNKTTANAIKTAISFVIMLGSTLALFEIFPISITKANHDVMMIMVCSIFGSFAYGYMEHVEMFEKKSN